jgi:hypothetical protein
LFSASRYIVSRLSRESSRTIFVICLWPDSGLKFIIAAILDDDLLKKFLESEKQAMKNILGKLKDL